MAIDPVPYRHVAPKNVPEARPSTMAFQPMAALDISRPSFILTGKSTHISAQSLESSWSADQQRPSDGRICQQLDSLQLGVQVEKKKLTLIRWTGRKKVRESTCAVSDSSADVEQDDKDRQEGGPRREWPVLLILDSLIRHPKLCNIFHISLKSRKTGHRILFLWSIISIWNFV
jgi:hypothetical protein